MTQDFRQGTIGTLEVTFFDEEGEIVPQPRPATVEVIYINNRSKAATAIQRTQMTFVADGRYRFDWSIPEDQPTVEHQIIYRGVIDGLRVIGEDTVTILPKKSQCVFEPTKLITKICGCH